MASDGAGEVDGDLKGYLEHKITITPRSRFDMQDLPPATPSNPIFYELAWNGRRGHHPVIMKVHVQGEGSSPNHMEDIIHARTLLGSDEGSFMRLTAMIQSQMGGEDNRILEIGRDRQVPEDEIHLPQYAGRVWIRSYSVEAVALLYLKACEDRQEHDDRAWMYSKPEYWNPANPEASRQRIKAKLDTAWNSRVNWFHNTDLRQ